ncbi:MAG: hypothetical protein DMG17_10140 [Acidobacteria bacterium]|nr:MAG: hypothetical protein DMG17_10140 [Acidobacteriota bacterium]
MSSFARESSQPKRPTISPLNRQKIIASRESIRRPPSAAFAANPDPRWVLFCRGVTPGDFHSRIGLIGKHDSSFGGSIVGSKDGATRNVLTAKPGDKFTLAKKRMKRSA